MDESAVCVPGQRLCAADKCVVSGHGTYERQNYIYASLVGRVDVVVKDTVKVIEVRRCGEQTIVPTQGDVVTAQVTILTRGFAKCAIRCVGDVPLGRLYHGVLRREDVRAAEKDRVDIYRCFRPGDIILARVLPIAEAHTYNLSTAENELGVVIAYSEFGHPMIPISWTEMQCTSTFVKEPRKVAKVVPENVDKSD